MAPTMIFLRKLHPRGSNLDRGVAGSGVAGWVVGGTLYGYRGAWFRLSGSVFETCEAAAP